MSKKITLPKIGISIVTFNSEKYISSCLQSLLKNVYPSRAYIVVDNGSKDKTCKIIKREFPNVLLLENKKNVGYAAAHNQAIKHFLKNKTRYVLLFNPDAIAHSDLLHELVTLSQQNRKIGAISPIITYASDKNKIWFAGGYYNNLFCYTRHPKMNKSLSKTTVKPGKIDFASGACMMLKSEIFNKVGFLPENYFLYFEDVFFCQQLKKFGYVSYLVAKPLAAHVVSSSMGKAGSNELTTLRAYYFARNPFLYIKKKVSGFYKLSNFLGQFLICFPFYVFQIVRSGDRSALNAYLKGFFIGVFQ